MENLKKFEYFIYNENELLLVMMNNVPLGLVKANSKMLLADVTEAIQSEGYSEVEFNSDQLYITDDIGDTKGNSCKVDGSKVNIHLITMQVFEF